jgi:four helix bundle protein
MFDFEKLEVYQVIKNHNVKVLKFLLSKPAIDEYIINQWKTASLDILLNLAEGTGQMTDAEKRVCLAKARSCVFESVAILDLLKEMGLVTEEMYNEFYAGYEQASKMLLGMYRSYSKEREIR